jgi:hypothetical protein
MAALIAPLLLTPLATGCCGKRCVRTALSTPQASAASTSPKWGTCEMHRHPHFSPSTTQHRPAAFPGGPAFALLAMLGEIFNSPALPGADNK